MNRHVLTGPGAILLAAGLLLYIGTIVAGVLRVGKQYSRTMAGTGWLRVNAAFAAAGKQWYFLVLAVVGAVLLLLSR